MKILGSYKNGNYTVSIMDEGTKIRENNLSFFKPDFPESMDIKITNKCAFYDANGKLLPNCAMCHENSGPNGKHGDIMNLEFIDKLHPFTELAIGGGNPLCHPDLEAFLEKCKRLKLIPSMTVNQKHFMDDVEYLKYLRDNKLIYGLGVSLTNPTDEFIETVKQFPNAVIHVIAGLVSIEALKKLANKGLKILILGYKQFRRGEALYSEIGPEIDSGIKAVKENLEEILSWFDVVSFDNLAIKQLEPKRLLSEEEYDEFFMGEDGFATMYVDAVNEEFALSSTSKERYPLKDNIVDMFNVIRT